MPPPGAVAERLGRGLQSLVQRFESARRLVSYGLELGLPREVASTLHESLAFHRSPVALSRLDFRVTEEPLERFDLSGVLLQETH